MAYLKHPEEDNSPWVLGMEPSCQRFRQHYAFFKNQLQNPQIFRLNTFVPGQYAWYFIRDGAALYLLQLIDAM